MNRHWRTKGGFRSGWRHDGPVNRHGSRFQLTLWVNPQSDLTMIQNELRYPLNVFRLDRQVSVQARIDESWVFREDTVMVQLVSTTAKTADAG